MHAFNRDVTRDHFTRDTTTTEAISNFGDSAGILEQKGQVVRRLSASIGRPTVDGGGKTPSRRIQHPRGRSRQGVLFLIVCGSLSPSTSCRGIYRGKWHKNDYFTVPTLPFSAHVYHSYRSSRPASSDIASNVQDTWRLPWTAAKTATWRSGLTLGTITPGTKKPPGGVRRGYRRLGPREVPRLRAHRAPAQSSITACPGFSWHRTSQPQRNRRATGYWGRSNTGMARPFRKELVPITGPGGWRIEKY